MGKNKLGTDFTEGSITKHMLRFLIPFLLANLLNSIYNLVDMIIIGHFVGSNGTVAVSLGGEMLILLTTLSNGIAGGGQIYIGQLFGAKKHKELNSTIGTLLTSLFVGAIILCIICIVLSKNILGWLNTPEESFNGARSYLIITCFGLPFVFGYNAVSSILRAMGDSKNPLIFILIATISNLVLDVLFVALLNMGPAGTALATIIGQAISLVFSLLLLYRKRETFGFDFKLKSFAIDRDKLKTMLKLGMPLSSKGVLIHVTQLATMSFVNAYGLIQATVYSVGTKILTYANIVSMSTSQAGGSMIAQNIGAGKPERAKSVVLVSLAICCSFSAICILLSVLFPRQLFLIFTTDEEVLAYARTIINITIIVHAISAFESPFGSMITGTGSVRLAFISGILDGVVLRICLGIFFGKYLDMQVVGFFLGSALARLAPFFINAGYFLSGAWRKRKSLVE